MKIVSDGSPYGTTVLNDDGTRMDFGKKTHLTGITIDPIVGGQMVSASLHFDWIDLDFTVKNKNAKGEINFLPYGE